MQNPKIVVHYDTNGPSGNIFYILGNVKNALRKERRIQDWNDCLERVQNCHSYEEALKIINEYVILKKI